MIKLLKRYAMALFFLFLVVLLMLLATMGVTKFGDEILQKTGTKVVPVGKRIDL